MYVADCGSDRVAIFTPSGEFIRNFGEKRDGERKLSRPQGLAIDSNGVVYVGEGGNTISMYSSDGHFLTSFGTYGNGPGQFCNPMDIAIDKDGQIYITDYINGHVQVF